MNDSITIGILGGMGTYATIYVFEQYAKIFQAQKEWDRPRIIIDNRCTMPSRVRAFLHNENIELLINQMGESLCNLRWGGANRIILACNTSHLFLPEIYKKHPEIKDNIVNIIDACVESINRHKLQQVYLLASEGTIESNIYQYALKKVGIKCEFPSKEEYSLLRICIEAVKQNKYSQKTKQLFCELMNRNDCCILGCTELPILYERYKKHIKCAYIFDPVLIALRRIREEFYD